MIPYRGANVQYHDPLTRGLTIFFTGLSGAGKSTIAEVLLTRLQNDQPRRATLLDGDMIRQSASVGLGFSKEHRDLNVRRVGEMAAAITRDGGIAICALIAPYDAARKGVRAMVEQAGTFFLVHVATPLAICERRDPKGLYARARAGTIAHFTGISDPYESPEDAELGIDTTDVTPETAAEAVVRSLQARGHLPPRGARRSGVSEPFASY
jgi:sulfate adenylyltransferase